MEATGYGAPLITHSIPDGHSCVLDKKNFAIDHEIGVTTLLGEGHRMAVIDRVRAKGGTLMGNGPCATRKLLAKKPQRMVEIQHNDSWAYEGNLDSPLGYASSRMDFRQLGPRAEDGHDARRHALQLRTRNLALRPSRLRRSNCTPATCSAGSESSPRTPATTAGPASAALCRSGTSTRKASSPAGIFRRQSAGNRARRSNWRKVKPSCWSVSRSL